MFQDKSQVNQSLITSFIKNDKVKENCMVIIQQLFGRSL